MAAPWPDPRCAWGLLPLGVCSDACGEGGAEGVEERRRGGAVERRRYSRGDVLALRPDAGIGDEEEEEKMGRLVYSREYVVACKGAAERRRGGGVLAREGFAGMQYDCFGRGLVEGVEGGTMGGGKGGESVDGSLEKGRDGVGGSLGRGESARAVVGRVRYSREDGVACKRGAERKRGGGVLDQETFEGMRYECFGRGIVEGVGEETREGGKRRGSGSENSERVRNGIGASGGVEGSGGRDGENGESEAYASGASGFGRGEGANDDSQAPFHDGRFRYSRAAVLALRRVAQSEACPSSLLRNPVLCKTAASKPPSLVPRSSMRGLGGISSGASQLRRDITLAGGDKGATFADLQLPVPLLSGLERAGFVEPSPVQVRGIPVGRLGADVIAQAKSGTGKTVVFCLLALETVLELESQAGDVAVLILAPTRDIAAQIRAVLLDLAVGMSPPPAVGLFIGGTPVKKDHEALSSGRPSIAVGTPGRVHDLILRGSMDVSSLKLLTLDEADRMLDSSFDDSVPSICSLLPSSKQVTTFSATYTPQLLRSLHAVMRDPQFVNLCEGEEEGGNFGGVAGQDIGFSNRSSRASVLHAVHQLRVAVALPPGAVNDRGQLVEENTGLLKIGSVVAILNKQPFGQAIVFSNDKPSGRGLKSRICDAGFSAVYTSGNERQATREKSMDAMRQGSARVLVATDLVARGVDLPGCDLVVHVDVPNDCATYLHRVGRAGRYGTLGVSILVHFDGGAELRAAEYLQRDLGMDIELSLAFTGKVGAKAAGDLSFSKSDRTQAVSPDQEDLKLEERDALVQNEAWRKAVDSSNVDRKDAERKDLEQAGVEPRGSEKSAEKIQSSKQFATDGGGSDQKSMDSAQISEEHHSAAHAASDFSVSAGSSGEHAPSAVNMSAEEAIWDDFAQSAYAEGWDHGYAMAHRVALDVVQRLGAEAFM